MLRHLHSAVVCVAAYAATDQGYQWHSALLLQETRATLFLHLPLHLIQPHICLQAQQELFVTALMLQVGYSKPWHSSVATCLLPPMLSVADKAQLQSHGQQAMIRVKIYSSDYSAIPRPEVSAKHKLALVHCLAGQGLQDQCE